MTISRRDILATAKAIRHPLIHADWIVANRSAIAVKGLARAEEERAPAVVCGLMTVVRQAVL